MDSHYDDQADVEAAVAAGLHRELIGGLWDAVGQLQFDFLVAEGLKPAHHLLDIGCGSLRGGVHFARYLEPGHYWGIDSGHALIEAGYEIELAQAGLQAKVPRHNLITDDLFRFEQFGRSFDLAIAQSLFTHLAANRIRLCLHNLAKVMPRGGRLFATFFIAPDDHPLDLAYRHPAGVESYAYQDPFHYTAKDLGRLVADTPWQVIWQGDWSHPRNQTMVVLERGG
jgi:cyclopropane fatty-acyl-phospholipid synthase-like methyltransferase